MQLALNPQWLQEKKRKLNLTSSGLKRLKLKMLAARWHLKYITLKKLLKLKELQTPIRRQIKKVCLLTTTGWLTLLKNQNHLRRTRNYLKFKLQSMLTQLLKVLLMLLNKA